MSSVQLSKYQNESEYRITGICQNVLPFGSGFLPPRTEVKDAVCDFHLVAELMVVIFSAQFVGNLPTIFLALPRNVMTLKFYHNFKETTQRDEIAGSTLSQYSEIHTDLLGRDVIDNDMCSTYVVMLLCRAPAVADNQKVRTTRMG